MSDHNRRSSESDHGLYRNRACFQNTGFGWWNSGEIAETLRTPVGGDSVKANLVVEYISDDPTPKLGGGALQIQLEQNGEGVS